MYSDISLAKFEDKVKEINNAIFRGSYKEDETFAYPQVVRRIIMKMPYTYEEPGIRYISQNVMALIYNRYNLNEYSKIVFNIVDMLLPGENFDSLRLIHKDERAKIIESTGYYASCAKKSPNCAIQFVFWALFILAVDNTDYEKHLSDICSIAVMMGLDNNDIHDIALAVKYALFDDDSIITEAKSEKVKNAFVDWIPFH